MLKNAEAFDKYNRVEKLGKRKNERLYWGREARDVLREQAAFGRLLHGDEAEQMHWDESAGA